MATQEDAIPHNGGQTPRLEPAQTQPATQLQQAEFLAKISHEIRTPLNAIMGYAEMLNKTSLDSKQQHFTTNIVKSSLALVDILNAWLQQAKDPSAPQNKQEQSAAAIVDAPVFAHDQASLKLLVVEDSSMIRDLFMDIFSEDHFAILTASTGAKALELACSELPQLIFLDLHLPDIDGWQVAKSLRGNPATAAIPLIAMTGQFLKAEEYTPCFDDFLQKPFQLKQLRSIVDSWLHSLPQHPTNTAQALPETADSSREHMEQDLTKCLRPYWNIQMSKLLAAVSHTGSLYVTIELGKCLQTVGQEQKCRPMEQAGNQLVHCALIPDIAGVEKIIAMLVPLMQGHSHE